MRQGRSGVGNPLVSLSPRNLSKNENKYEHTEQPPTTQTHLEKG